VSSAYGQSLSLLDASRASGECGAPAGAADLICVTDPRRTAATCEAGRIRAVSWADAGPVLTVVVRCDLVVHGPDVAPAWPLEGTAGEGELAVPGSSARIRQVRPRAQKSLNSMLSKKATASTMAPARPTRRPLNHEPAEAAPAYPRAEAGQDRVGALDGELEHRRVRGRQLGRDRADPAGSVPGSRRGLRATAVTSWPAATAWWRSWWPIPPVAATMVSRMPLAPCEPKLKSVGDHQGCSRTAPATAVSLSGLKTL
jgi:hypothetical protein